MNAPIVPPLVNNQLVVLNTPPELIPAIKAKVEALERHRGPTLTYDETEQVLTIRFARSFPGAEVQFLNHLKDEIEKLKRNAERDTS